jgi:hypothetical protein
LRPSRRCAPSQDRPGSAHARQAEAVFQPGEEIELSKAMRVG